MFPFKSGEIADSSPAISALSARKSVNHSLEWKDLAIVTKNSTIKQPQVNIRNQGLKQFDSNLHFSRSSTSASRRGPSSSGAVRPLPRRPRLPAPRPARRRVRRRACRLPRGPPATGSVAAAPAAPPTSPRTAAGAAPPATGGCPVQKSGLAGNSKLSVNPFQVQQGERRRGHPRRLLQRLQHPVPGGRRGLQALYQQAA